MDQGIVLYGVQIPYGKGQFWGKGLYIVKYRDLLPWGCAETAEPIDCCLGCGLGWAKGSTSQPYLPGGANVHNFNRIYQVAPM